MMATTTVGGGTLGTATVEAGAVIPAGASRQDECRAEEEHERRGSKSRRDKWQVSKVLGLAVKGMRREKLRCAVCTLCSLLRK